MNVTCPACATLLAIPGNVLAGRCFRCPRCRQPFTVPAEVPESLAVRTTPPQRIARPSQDAEEDSDRSPREMQRRSRSRGKASTPVGLILGLSLGAFLLLGSALLGAILLLSPDNSPASVAQGKPGERERRAVSQPQQPPPRDPPTTPTPENPPTEDPRPEPPPADDVAVGLEVGNRAPEIEGEDLDGKKFKLSDHRGKVVLLSFWGNWCPYCRELYPNEQSLVKTMEKRPFVLIGVNSDEDREALQPILKKERISWRSFWNGGGLGGPISEAWQVRIWPTLFLIDARGIIRDKWIGPPPAMVVDKAVEAVVKEAERTR